MSEKKTPMQKFSAWFYGKEDPFTEAMPVKAQKEHQIDEQILFVREVLVKAASGDTRPPDDPVDGGLREADGFKFRPGRF